MTSETAAALIEQFLKVIHRRLHETTNWSYSNLGWVPKKHLS